MIKAVILDWAGTTIDYGCKTPTIAFKKVIEKHINKEVSTDIIRQYMGLKKVDHLIAVLDEIKFEYNNDLINSMMQDIDAEIRLVVIRKTTIIDGTIEFQKYLKSKNIKIGSNTGYTRNMMNVIQKMSYEQGYNPDYTIASDEISMGRPYPWGCYKIAEKLNVFPLSKCIKFGDNPVDMQEGLNANMWCVGIVESSNIIGLDKEELEQHQQKEQLIENAKNQLLNSGAHLVIRTIKQGQDAVEIIEKYIHQNGDIPQLITTDLI